MVRATYIRLVLPILAASGSPAWADFTPEQSAAFAEGAGAAGEDLTLLIAGITAFLALGGIAWIAFSAFQTWADGRLSAGGLAALLLRAAALLTLIGVLLR